MRRPEAAQIDTAADVVVAAAGRRVEFLHSDDDVIGAPGVEVSP
jgi:hypothetical protein